ncbi:MAG: ABC transporter ATP-binding protein [Dehalococcoidales bacterium]|nr:ABC transporter ATP-binding protein [Dehalococcoidales bacterium]
MKQKLKRLFKAYGELLGEIYKQAPGMVVLTFVAAIISGLFTPVSIFVNTHIFNDGISVAKGQMTFGQYTPYIVLFVLVTILPNIITNIFVYGYVEPRSLLILRTALKGRMLEKIKRMKYEHFESEASMEIIDKAYNRAEGSARHMFPMYVVWTLSSFIASIGGLWYLFNVRWWLVLTVITPWILESFFITKDNLNIYDELETYWNNERRYGILGGFLKTREYLKENKLFGASDYLIDTYKTRLNNRNREYEGFYFKHLKRHFTQYNITKISQLANVIILLVLFVHGQMSVGLFISLTLLVFTTIYFSLGGTMIFFRASGYHMNFFDYFNKYFDLSEDKQGEINTLPEAYDIEFKDVWFRYPNTERNILKGLSLKVRHGEKVSIVGENGEGKTTMIKLLMGLFTPDRGTILINGRSLFEYSPKARSKLFGTVFQDFTRYSITVKENVALGDIDAIDNKEVFENAIKEAKADGFINNLPNKENTLLGRDFEGGIDISGGQWQRIAIARAFMGDKPVLILDEPTSQLDPVAESNLYSEFATMASNKTAIFITHRLASTMITDKIFVISDGKLTENGTHNELMKLGGLYAKMFEAQKQWYNKNEAVEDG